MRVRAAFDAPWLGCARAGEANLPGKWQGKGATEPAGSLGAYYACTRVCGDAARRLMFQGSMPAGEERKLLEMFRTLGARDK